MQTMLFLTFVNEFGIDLCKCFSDWFILSDAWIGCLLFNVQFQIFHASSEREQFQQ